MNRHANASACTGHSVRHRRSRRAVRSLTFWAVAAACLAWACALDAEDPPVHALRFVQLCDPQLGFGAHGYEADLKSLKQAIRQINRLKPHIVIVCGDLVNTPDTKSFADFRAAMEECKVPYYCAAGNHDIGHPLRPELLEDFHHTIGKDYDSIEHNGYSFVVVNTQRWKSPTDPETAKHDAWFADRLQEARQHNRPVLVVGHHPLFLKTADEAEEYFNIAPAQRRKILDLMTTHGVIAMLTGHTHRLVSNTYRDIQLLSGETTSKNFDERPLGFRLWTIEPAGPIRHEFVALEDD